MRINKYGLLVAVSVLMAGVSPTLAHAISAPVPTASSASLPNTSVTSASIKITWPSVAGAVGYQVVATASDNTTTTQSVPFASGTTTYQTIFTNLSGGALYKFTVTSTDSSGIKATSDQVSQVAQSVPEAPTAGSPTIAIGAVALSWSPPTNTGGVPVTGFTISEKSLTSPIIVAGTVLQKTITGLAAGHTYSFTIVASNSIGNSTSATFADATVPAVPATPAAPTAAIDPTVSTTINATWTAPNDNGTLISGYTVNLYNSSNALVAHMSATTVSAKFSSVAVGTYTVKVIAINGAGSSSESLASQPVIVAAAPAQRTNTPVITPAVINALSPNATASVSAVAPSGDTVTLTVRGNPTGACTISGGVITGVSPGTCTLTASVPASSNGTYAAGSASKTFDISKTAQSITFSSVNTQTAETTINLSATASSGLTVSFAAVGTCTMNSSIILSLIAPGTCVVTASQSGNATYAAATSVNRTITVTAPVVSPTPTPSSNGGGSGGGGGFVQQAPVPTPSKSPKPEPTTTPAPAPVAKPSPEPTVTPTPTNQPVDVKKSGVIPPHSIPTNSAFSAVTDGVAPKAIVKLSSSAATQSTEVKKNSTIALNLPSVAKGTAVKEVLVGPDGKKYVLVAGTTSTAGKVNSPTLKFAKPGIYTVTITVGKVKKTVKMTVK